jgi:hypothetical protein
MPMIIRNSITCDAESEARIYNAVASNLPGFQALTSEDVRRNANGRGDLQPSRLYADDDGAVVGYLTFESCGRVYVPWCLPGHEKMAHVLLTSALHELHKRQLTRAIATCRTDWLDQIELFEDHEFDRVRDMVNFTQSIGDLPTMFQRPGLDVSLLRRDDVAAIAGLVPGLLRLQGPELVSFLFDNHGFPADAFYVLRKDGDVRGVGLLIDDAAFAKVENLDPLAPVFRFGAFGTESLPSKRVNGLFSFIAAPGKDALLIGQDLLWYGTSRMETNTFEKLAAQAPSDAPHLLNFYKQYFREQGRFPVLELNLN